MAQNPFGEQPVKFRLEVLMSAQSYYDANNIVMADFSDLSQFEGLPRAGDGVIASLNDTSEGRHFLCLLKLL